MVVTNIVNVFTNVLWSLPVLLLFFGAAIYLTVSLRFVQFSYFKKAVKLIFKSESNQGIEEVETLSPFQAFVNTLGANIGNGSLAGMAVAICAGGPGSIFWLLVFTTFSVVFRFAEVALSSYVIGKYSFHGAKGGPMVYLSKLPGGTFLSYAFALFALFFMLVCGNIAQCHSVGLAMARSFCIPEYLTAAFIGAFVVYVLFGGTKRIVAFLDKMVPLKVGLFLISACVILLYHYKAIPGALYIILHSAFYPQAILGGTFAFALQQSIAVGFQRSLFASEAGLGTSGIAFGTTEGKNPIENGLLSMLGVYITVHIISFMVALCILASGVWNNGETSVALLVSAYETVFGKLGGVIITILAVNFAMSVVVASAYIGKECWKFLLQGKYLFGFSVVYVLAAFMGTIMEVMLVWNLSNIVNALLLCINVIGLIWFAPIIKQELLHYGDTHGAD